MRADDHRARAAGGERWLVPAALAAPLPYLIPWPGHAVVVIPAADFADHADWMAGLCEILEGRERPGSVKQLRETERMREYRDFWERAARAVAVSGSLGPQSAVLAPEGPEPASWPQDAIKLSVGGRLVGKTSECLRQLIQEHKLRGWPDRQGHWHVSRAELIAYGDQHWSDVADTNAVLPA